MHKRYICAVLPLGYSNSWIYQLAPRAVKLMNLSSNPVVVVASPLTALMEQQVKEADKLDVTAATWREYQGGDSQHCSTVVIWSRGYWMITGNISYPCWMITYNNYKYSIRPIYWANIMLPKGQYLQNRKW